MMVDTGVSNAAWRDSVELFGGERTKMPAVVGRPPERLLVAGIVLFGAGLRIYGIGAESFWIDEVFQIQRASWPISDFLGGLWTLDPTRLDKSFLVLVVHHLLLDLRQALGLEHAEWLLRLPSAVFSVAELAVLYPVARRLTGVRTAVLGVFFLALSPLHIWYAQETRWYALWSLLATLSFLALVAAWDLDSLGAWIAYGVSLVLAAATFPLTFVVMACQGASVLLLCLKRGTWGFFGRYLLASAFGLLALLPFLLYVGGGEGTAAGTPRPFQLAALPYAFFAYAGGYSVGPSVAELHFLPGLGEILRSYPEVLIFGTVFGSLVLLGAWVILHERPGREILLPWIFGIPVIVFAGSALTDVPFNVRYALPALPAFMTLTAVGVETLAARRAPLGWTGLAAVTVCLAYGTFNYHVVDRYDKEDSRGAVEIIRASDSAGAPVLVAGQVVAAVHHYAGGLKTHWLPDCRPEDGNRLEVLSPPTAGRPVLADTVPTSAFRDPPVLWLVIGRDWEGAGEECLEWLRRSHAVTREERLSGIELFQLVRRGRTR